MEKPPLFYKIAKPISVKASLTRSLLQAVAELLLDYDVN
jgi:hypothetical protein